MKISSPGEIATAIAQLTFWGNAAWQKSLLPGFSGNLSIRLTTEAIAITASGVPKGFLQADDFAIVTPTGQLLAGKKASSELALHLAIYGAFAEVQTILHSHPPYLQTLETRYGQIQFTNLHLYEASYWQQRLTMVPAIPPGDTRLADVAIAELMQNKNQLTLPWAVWLGQHGLCAIGNTLQNCFAITEELEHLAKVEILAQNPCEAQ